MSIPLLLLERQENLPWIFCANQWKIRDETDTKYSTPSSGNIDAAEKYCLLMLHLVTLVCFWAWVPLVSNKQETWHYNPCRDSENHNYERERGISCFCGIGIGGICKGNRARYGISILTWPRENCNLAETSPLCVQLCQVSNMNSKGSLPFQVLSNVSVIAWLR